MALDLQKFIGRFVQEARDHLTGMEAGVNALNETPEDAEAISALFRSAHTVKGSARMLKLGGIAETAHRLEDVLAALRDGRLRHRPEIGDLLLRAIDGISTRVDLLEVSGADPVELDQGLCDDLARILTGETPVPMAPPEGGGDGPPGAAAPGTADRSEPTRARGQRQETVRVPLARLDELIQLLGVMLSSQARLRRYPREAQALAHTAQCLGEMGQTGIARGLAQHARAVQELAHGLREEIQAQDSVTMALNDRALALRMLPLSMVFDPLPRMVRELGRTLGKEVSCETSGGDVELDREIIERLGDCLVHSVRNAVDHGIEDGETRRAAGKPTLGRIRVSARQLGAGVAVDVVDDGAGLNRQRILAKAIARGLVDPADAEQLSDAQVAELIFEPGFSTSDIITDLSGRGVGLDVVKRTIVDDLRGGVTIASRPGRGSTLGFKLPLSLALMRVLLFETSGQAFALAAQHVVEIIRVAPGETITVAGRPAVVLRNELVPLIPLAELLGLTAPVSASGRTGEADQTLRLVVVIRVSQSKLGLVVDRLLDEGDMLIKPLPAHMRDCHLIGGIVSAGDDALVSVLQAPSIMEVARRVWGETALRSSTAGPARAEDAQPRHILVVDDSLNTREIEQEVLQAYGYRVTTAEDGLDGWQKAVGGHFDAVLTDVEMPRLDGFSLTAKLREHERYRTVPIVIITSRQKEEDKRRGIEVGADAYIVKSDFEQSSLLETLRNLVG